MSENFIVTKECLPKRCEICHQSDLFVASIMVCERCKDLTLVNDKVDVIRKNNISENSLPKYVVLGFLLLLLVFLIFILVKVANSTYA